MAYSKTNWVNGQAPALSAENLNKMEEGIYNNSISSDYLLDEDTILIDKFTTPSHTFPATGQTGSTWWIASEGFHAPTHAGYTAVGIIGQSPNNRSMLIPCVTIVPKSYGDLLVGYIRNSDTSSFSDTITVTILYVKDEHLNII